MPNCYIIAGPNGAGKTTFAVEFLPTIVQCDSFINADMIAAGISPLNPEKAQIRASRIFLAEIKKQIVNKANFSFETTLSGSAYLKTIQKLKSDGWNIILFYLWIPGIEFSAKRVELRVKQGGHDIPAEAIKRRYNKSIKNLMNKYIEACDQVYCYDNSKLMPEMIFEYDESGFTVMNDMLYTKIMEVSNGN